LVVPGFHPLPPTWLPLLLLQTLLKAPPLRLVYLTSDCPSVQKEKKYPPLVPSSAVTLVVRRAVAATKREVKETILTEILVELRARRELRECDVVISSKITNKQRPSKIYILAATEEDYP